MCMYKYWYPYFVPYPTPLIFNCSPEFTSSNGQHSNSFNDGQPMLPYLVKGMVQSYGKGSLYNQGPFQCLPYPHTTCYRKVVTSIEQSPQPATGSVLSYWRFTGLPDRAQSPPYHPKISTEKPPRSTPTPRGGE